MEKAVRNKLKQCWLKYVLQLLAKVSKYHNKSNSSELKLELEWNLYWRACYWSGLLIKVGDLNAFLYFLASNYLCRFSSALTDFNMDTSNKLARTGSLNRVYPQTCQTVWATTLTFWAVYLQLLKLLFHYIKIISLFKLCFKFISPVHIISRRVQFGSVIRKVEYLKLKTSCMVTFISIEYSEPNILTWNLHHHSPSYLAVLLCLRDKLAHHVPLFDSPVNFAEQYSALIVW